VSTTAANGDASSTTAAPGSTPGAGASTTAKGATGTTAKGAAGATTLPAPTTTAKPTAPANDVNTAKTYLLTAADVGAGYTKDSSSDRSSSSVDIEKCGKGNPVFAKDNPNDIKGDDFTKGTGPADSAAVGSDTTIAASVAQATDAMNIVKTEEFLRCIEQQAKDQAAKQAPPGTTFDVKASRKPLTGGDDATDVHLVVTATYAATKYSGDIDVLVYRKTKFLATSGVVVFGSTNAGEPARIAEIMKKKLG
jgi:hypothetical protein